jgi:multiple antibiotic resistance protein
MDLYFAITVIMAVFAIVNPVGNVSFFVALTRGYSRGEQKAVIRKVVIVATAVLSVFALIGNFIFEMFSITIPAFRIAGGLLLLTIAFSMLQGSHPKSKVTDRDKEEALAREAVGIVPLGIPMFAGPGAITTVMIYMSEATMEGISFDQVALVFAAILVTMVLSYVILSYGEKIFERIGRMGTLAFSRIMGLILAAMAVQFMMDGIINFVIDSGVVAV